MASRARPEAEHARSSEYAAFAARHPEFITTIRRLRERRGRMLDRLAALPRTKQHGEVRKLLRSGNLHLLYAFVAMKSKRLLADATPDSIAALAATCDPFRPSNELISTLIVQRSRRARVVQDFGPKRRMQQLLVADLLRTLHPPRQDQFLMSGGMPMALRAVEAAFREGYTHAVEVDLIDFYGRVRLPGLADKLRPLPGAVTDHAVWDVSARRSLDDIATTQSMVSPTASGLVGLSLGAATSPVVGEIIIRHLLDTAQLDRVVTYADNILILGRGRDDAARGAEHLQEVSLGFDAGSLALRVGDTVGFRDEHKWVEFAGHRGRAIRHRLNWEPNLRKQDEHRIADISSELSEAELAKAETKVSHCRRAYPMWKTADKWEAQRLAELAAVRYYQNARPEHLADARNKLVVAVMVSRGLSIDDLTPDGTIQRHIDRRAILIREAEAFLAQMAANTSQQAA